MKSWRFQYVRCYRLDFGDFLNINGRLVLIYFRLWPQRGYTYQPRAEPVPTGVALGLEGFEVSPERAAHCCEVNPINNFHHIPRGIFLIARLILPRTFLYDGVALVRQYIEPMPAIEID